MCECCGSNNVPAEPVTPEEPKSPVKPEITFDDFAKLDLRVGKVIEVAAHPNADKLLVLKVDLGFEVRTICAGVKAFYAPEAILGRNIIIVANLAPRKLRGIESHGMLLAASNEDHTQVVLLTTEKEDVAPGSSCG